MLWGAYSNQLTSTIAHEEAHHRHWFRFLVQFNWVHHDSRQQDFVYRIGSRCGAGFAY